MFASVTIILLICLTGIRLSVANNSISFDYQFYIEFIDEVKKAQFSVFIENIVSEIPYYPWGDFGKFEFGFAILVYAFPATLSSNTIYTTIACASLLWKLEIMRRFRVPVPVLILFFIFFVTLFESNALRAGVALAFLMAGTWQLVRHGSVWRASPYFLLSVTFHLSAIIVIGMIILSYISTLLSISRRVLMAILLIALVIPINLLQISSLFGGKVAEYVLLADSFDLYTGASAFNIGSGMALLFFLFFFVAIKRGFLDFVTASNSPGQLVVRTGLLLSYTAACLIVFSGALSIIGGRMWLLILPIITCLMCLFYTTERPIGGRAMPWFSIAASRQRANGLVIAWIPWLILSLVGLYIVVNLLIRYPQSNFFDFLLDRVEVIPPEPVS